MRRLLSTALRRHARLLPAFGVALSSLAIFEDSARAQEAPSGAQATPQVTPPSVLTHVDAQYPPSALAERRHGDVVLVLTVDADGHVSKVDVAQSGGADLDEAATFAARQWTFVPATKNGKPAASRIRVPFHFAPPEAPPDLVAPKRDPAETELPPATATHAAPEPPEVHVTGRPNPPSRGPSDFRIPRTISPPRRTARAPICCPPHPACTSRIRKARPSRSASISAASMPSTARTWSSASPASR